jgi:hypothetical protein
MMYHISVHPEIIHTVLYADLRCDTGPRKQKGKQRHILRYTYLQCPPKKSATPSASRTITEVRARNSCQAEHIGLLALPSARKLKRQLRLCESTKNILPRKGRPCDYVIGSWTIFGGADMVAIGQYRAAHKAPIEFAVVICECAI